MKAEILGYGRQVLPALRPLHRPVSIPHAPPVEADAGDTWTGSIQAFMRVEPFTVDVSQSQVREVCVIYAPCGLILHRLAPQALTEEDQFESETLSFGATQV